jgi:hypothetical protein
MRKQLEESVACIKVLSDYYKQLREKINWTRKINDYSFDFYQDELGII